MGPPCRRYSRLKSKNQFIFQLLVSLALGSYLIAYALDVIRRGVHKWRKRTPSPIPDHLRQTSVPHNLSNETAQLERQYHTDTETGLTGIGPSNNVELGDLQTTSGEVSVQAEMPAVPIDSTGDRRSSTPAGGDALIPRPQEACASRVLQPEHSTALHVHADASVDIPAAQLETSSDSTANMEHGLHATDVGPRSSLEHQNSTVDGTPDEPQFEMKFSSLSNTLFTLTCWVIMPIVYIPVMALMYSGLWDFGDSADAQQDAAERGTVCVTDNHQQTPAPVLPEAARVTNTVFQDLLHGINLVCKFIVRWILMLIWRLFLGCASIYGGTFKWVEWRVTEKPELAVTAFGLANFTAMAVYYLAMFDAKGTVAPSWVNVFGK